MGAGGGIPTPNWDALADIDAVGGVTRADVVPRVVAQLTAEASNSDNEGSHSVYVHLHISLLKHTHLGYIIVKVNDCFYS